ncbi:protein of unknown function [Oceanobacillus limi]|uniref:DUF4181 domain-containing protein n=1 Tax=Oceanobacillus limi TaxID=930131 RepID=A0A1H9Y6A1_9BACI|nr:DUF4181 domain-containing protein [Oceanobacillus limi]SES63951.1 protein of unknown function [Oceanobacillus limi]
MGYFVMLGILILWFYIGKALRRKLNLPKRSWVYKHWSNKFAILFYITIVVAFLYGTIGLHGNLFLLFPFLGAIVNLFFSMEQAIYKKGSRLHTRYLLDAIAWFGLGITATIFF